MYVCILVHIVPMLHDERQGTTIAASKTPVTSVVVSLDHDHVLGYFDRQIN